MAATYEELMAKARELASVGRKEEARRVAQIALSRRDAAPVTQSPQDPVAQSPMQDRGFWHSVGDNIIGFDDGVDSLGERIGRGVSGSGTQMMAGANEGVASLAGMPVDLATGAVNLGVRGVNSALGSDIPQISDPVGGGSDMHALMSPFITADEPQNAMERYSRSVGRDIGASAIPVGAGLGAAKSAMSPIVAALQSSFGSGIASQAARDVAPDSPIVEALAGLAGGVAPLAWSRAPRPRAPSTGDLKSQAGDLYEAGRARAAAGPAAVADLRAQSEAVLRDNSRITPTGRVQASGNVKSYLDVLEDYQGQPMTPGEMQNIRTYLQDGAKSVDAGERRIATILLDRFDDWRAKRVPEFGQADILYGRAKRADDVDFRIEKAERRADSTGTGGNAVNAARQNLRQILDNPKARRGYSETEIAMMEDIVRGDTVTNALRLAGRLSPTSGALPLAGNIIGVGVNPAIGATVMGTGMASKGLAELLTNRQISRLSEAIRSGGNLVKPSASEAEKAILKALLASTATGDETD